MKNLFENDFEEFYRKVNRYKYNPEFNKIFYFCWSNKTYYKERRGIKTFHLKTLFFKKRILFDIVTIFVLPFILLKAKFKPDVILVNDFQFVVPSYPIKLILRSKIALLLIGHPTAIAKTRKYASFRVIYQKIYEKISAPLVDVFVANSKSTKKYLMNLNVLENRIHIAKGDVIKQDFEHIKNVNKGYVHNKYNIDSYKKIILSVGRLEFEKNYKVLINLFSNLKNKNSVLIIVGDGILRESLEKYCIKKQIDKQVIFAGKIERDEIWSYYNDSDLFILLSTSEGLGLSFWEAMYMNVPVIGSMVGGIKNTIGSNEERGFFWKKDEDNYNNDIINQCLHKTETVKKKIIRAKHFVDQEVLDDRIINDFVK